MQKIYRVIDANFNRVKEGLRVIEEYFRFIIENPEVTKNIKQIRHELSQIVDEKMLKECVRQRDVENDFISKEFIETEIFRKDAKAVVCANFQRVKEGLRVLEEYIKIVDAKKAQEIQGLRFRVYQEEMK